MHTHTHTHTLHYHVISTERDKVSRWQWWLVTHPIDNHQPLLDQCHLVIPGHIFGRPLSTPVSSDVVKGYYFCSCQKIKQNQMKTFRASMLYTRRNDHRSKLSSVPFTLAPSWRLTASPIPISNQTRQTRLDLPSLSSLPHHIIMGLEKGL